MKLNKSFYVKYVHLLYGHDTKFSDPLIAMFNDANNGFNITEHVFITKYPSVFEQLKLYPNVILDLDKCNFYRKYYKHCNFIISHSSEGGIKEIFTAKKIKKHVVLRYWGGATVTHLKLDSKNPFVNLNRLIKIMIFKNHYNSYAAIGVANSVDIIDLSPLLPHQKYYRLSYCDAVSSEVIKMVKKKLPIHNNKPKILLGHRGTKENNHIKILKKLDKYDPDKFDIYVLLSYGDKEYISVVKEYIMNNHCQNVHIIDKFMQYPKYIEFLSTIDIGIFDGDTSYALGNIGILLHFKKTLYLNPNGVIAKALNNENGPYKDVNKIGNMQYEDFIRLVAYRKDYVSDLEPQSIENKIANWKKLFQDFEN